MANTEAETKGRVLVLDHPDTERAKVYAILNSLGYKVDVENSDSTYFLTGHIAQALKGVYGAIIVNVEHGIGLAMGDTADRLKLNVPIIAVSNGDSPIKEPKDAHYHKFDDLVHFPFEGGQLESTVRACFDGSLTRNPMYLISKSD